MSDVHPFGESLTSQVLQLQRRVNAKLAAMTREERAAFGRSCLEYMPGQRYLLEDDESPQEP